MIRTQIYLDKKQYEDVKLWAKIAGKSSAEVIRDFITSGLSQRERARGDKGLLRLSHLNVKGGPKDLASNLDTYLYEQKH